MATYTLQSIGDREFQKLGDHVELRDSSGGVVGYFVTPDAYRKLQYQSARNLVSDEQLDAVRKQPGGKTLSEMNLIIKK